MTEFELPSFEPLDESRAEFLKHRSADVLEAVPAYADLRERLLSLGGVGVVPPAFDPSSAAQRARQHHDVHQVLQKGHTWVGAQADLDVMETSNCHLNVARLRTSGRGQIASGWALPADGLWREHSWLVRSPGTAVECLLETTRPWLLYHGYLLSEEETGWFVRAELGPEAWPQ
jgi:hypothetical protein